MKKDFLVASVLSALYFVVLSLMLLEVRIHSLLEKLPYFYVKKKKSPYHPLASELYLVHFN